MGLGITVWCYYFFRDPERVVPQSENFIISPADGVVSLIQEVTPPAEMGWVKTTDPCVSVYECLQLSRKPSVY